VLNLQILDTVYMSLFRNSRVYVHTNYDFDFVCFMLLFLCVSIKENSDHVIINREEGNGKPPWLSPKTGYL